ncbi:aldo/keto reductase [Hephaestia mangrovi]|uniref:aldo/keto reductase n=1 Tax=Hephaestia mangrovi TaxID=2873268 RepID=UPI001CA73A7E|nr:aldo/keto reductase [Hephaestia mangrovi]MBY8827300.1 aldo/keto reductase [Hephaestia mangrovi]
MNIAKRRVGSTGISVTELGFGAGTLGNLYRALDDSEARATADAAIEAGITYFDTAPFYGFGLSERRLGDATRRCSDLVISSKVGRLLVADRLLAATETRDGFAAPLPFRVRYDYSYDGVMRSYEASLQRLGLARIDFLFVHDIGRMNLGDAHDQHWRDLVDGGGFRALGELRESGAIAGFGLGVNETAVCMDAIAEADLDVILLAGRYTLLEQEALDDLLPTCVAKGISIVIGGPYNSGILATGTKSEQPTHYNYQLAPAPIVERVRRIEAVADSHGVSLPAAALQFPLAHPAVASVIPGMASPRQVQQSVELMREAVPEAFWRDLRQAGLIRADAPVPALASSRDAERPPMVAESE